MTTNRPLLATIGWGLFCSASWTWCIGMFLPFVLLREYGWRGFLAFFIPNVIGCAAFGYILSPKRQERLIASCGGICRWFSWITLAYQAYFAGWMLDPVVAIGVVAIPVMGARFLKDRHWLQLSTLVVLATLMSLFWDHSGSGLSSFNAVNATGSNPPDSLWGLAPAIALGFIACPYLDLTFHRALRSSPSRHAFFVFGIAFALTILGIAWCWDPTLQGPAITNALMIVWAIQLSFTIGAHLSGCPGLGWAQLSPAGNWFLLVGLALGWIARFVEPSWLEPTATYKRFLVFYGLVFPFAFLLRIRRVSNRITALAILACLPFYELGFMHNQTTWLFVPIGLLCVLLVASLDKSKVKEPRPA